MHAVAIHELTSEQQMGAMMRLARRKYLNSMIYVGISVRFLLSALGGRMLFLFDIDGTLLRGMPPAHRVGALRRG